MSELSKMTVVNALLRACYPARFLELSTPLTGHEFSHVRTELCARADLAKYRVNLHSERVGLDVNKADIEDDSPSSERLVESILRRIGNRPKYDVILCDPYHSYQDSLNDLRNAWTLLVPGGTLVVHDCNPATEQFASPVGTDGIWCGRTFEAFLDFVRKANLPYFTIDADHGIGVIPKRGNRCSGHPFDSLFKTMTPEGRAVWESSSPDEDRFAVFDSCRADLLNLVSGEAFTAISPGLRMNSSDELCDSPEVSRLARAGGLRPTEWTRGRTRTEIIGRYEEMVGRGEAQRAAAAQCNHGLRARINHQQVLIENLSSSVALSATATGVSDMDCAQAELKLDGLSVDLAACSEKLLLAKKELAEQAAEVTELANLVLEKTSELLTLKSSSTFRLRGLALRARFLLILWRTGAVLVTRARTQVRSVRGC